MGNDAVNSSVRDVLVGYKGKLAKHIVETLGDRTIADPVIRDIVQQYLVWHDIGEETGAPWDVSAGSMKEQLGSEIWNVVDSIVGISVTSNNKEDNVMGNVEKQDSKGTTRRQPMAARAKSFVDTNLSAAEMGEAVLDLDSPGEVESETVSSESVSSTPPRSLREWVRTCTTGKGHNKLMAALSLSKEPDKDEALQSLFKTFYTMWISRTTEGWDVFYNSVEAYIIDHGGKVEPRIANPVDGLPGTGSRNPHNMPPRRRPQDTSGMITSPHSRDASTGRTDASTRVSEDPCGSRRGIGSRIGTALLNGVVSGMNATSTAIVGIVVPGVVGSGIRASTAAVIGLEDAAHESRVTYNKAWIDRYEHDDLPELHAKVRAIKAARKAMSKTLVDAVLVDGTGTDTPSTEEELPL